MEVFYKSIIINNNLGLEFWPVLHTSFLTPEGYSIK